VAMLVSDEGRGSGTPFTFAKQAERKSATTTTSPKQSDLDSMLMVWLLNVS